MNRAVDERELAPDATDPVTAGPSIQVTLADLLRFFARVAVWTVLIAGPVAVLTFYLANRTAPVYEAEAVVLAPLRQLRVDLPGTTQRPPTRCSRRSTAPRSTARNSCETPP